MHLHTSKHSWTHEGWRKMVTTAKRKYISIFVAMYRGRVQTFSQFGLEIQTQCTHDHNVWKYSDFSHKQFLWHCCTQADYALLHETPYYKCCSCITQKKTSYFSWLSCIQAGYTPLYTYKCQGIPHEVKYIYVYSPLHCMLRCCREYTRMQSTSALHTQMLQGTAYSNAYPPLHCTLRCCRG